MSRCRPPWMMWKRFTDGHAVHADPEWLAMTERDRAARAFALRSNRLSLDLTDLARRRDRLGRRTAWVRIRVMPAGGAFLRDASARPSTGETPETVGLWILLRAAKGCCAAGSVVTCPLHPRSITASDCNDRPGALAGVRAGVRRAHHAFEVASQVAAVSISPCPCAS